MGISKLFIFVLFGTVVQISSAPLSSAFCIIQTNERITDDALHRVVDIIFSVINYEAKVSLGIEKEVDGRVEVIEAVKENLLQAWTDSLVATFSAISAIASDPPPDSAIADLSAEGAQLAQIGECIFDAIAYCSQYAGTLEQIEEKAAQATAIILDIFKTVFQTLRNNQGSRQKGVAAAINAVEAKVLASIRTLFTAIFRAITVLYNIRNSEVPILARDILNLIGLLENLAYSIIEDEVINKYQLFRAIVASITANSPKIVSQFTVIQSAEQNSKAGWNATLSPILDLLEGIYECDDIESATEAIEDQAVEGLRSAYLAFADVIEILRTDGSPEIVIDQSSVRDNIETAIENVLNSIILARSENHANNVAAISANGEAVIISGILGLISDLFTNTAQIIVDCPDVALEIEIVRKATLADLQRVLQAIFDAIISIAEHDSTNNKYVTQRLPFLITITRLVVLNGLQHHHYLEYTLFRAISIRNSLSNNGLTLNYCVNVA